MKRVWLYPLLALALALSGYGAFTLGRALRPEPPLAGTALQNPVAVGDVALRGSDGQGVALSSFAGNYLLVFFGYTRCPDVCPLTLARLAEVYGDLGEPENLRVLMITVDPEHDTPELTQRYAGSFHPDFLGLGGSNTEVAEAAQTFYIGFQAAGEEVIHTDAVVLVDPESRMRVVYSQPSLSELRGDLARLL